jgi:FdhD protein
LAVGFLFTEGMIKKSDDVRTVRYCQLPDSAEQQFNVVTVSLSALFDEALSRRGMVTSASCGICGTTSIEQLAQITSRIDLAVGPCMPQALSMRRVLHIVCAKISVDTMQLTK